jgi:hypothetical protein
MSSQTSPDKQSASHKRNRLVLVVIVVLTVTIVAAYFIHQSSIQPRSTPIARGIVSGNVMVNVGSYVSRNFTVPSMISNARVDGTFAVSGGIQNTIKLYIMDGASFVDWQNGLQASMFYDSGEANSGNVTATLPSTGTYYLVFDNTFSAASKNVTAYAHFFYFPA